MRSVAIVDNRDGSTIAVWITTRVSSLSVSNVNAVVVNTATDPGAIEKVRLLTRDRAVFLTEGSSADGLPVEGRPLTITDIATLIAETEALQQRILDAIAAFAVRPDPKTGQRPAKPRKIVSREIPVSPRQWDFKAKEDVPAMRALAAANYLARAWSLWLETDDERRKRSLDVKGRPWMMPPDLANPLIAELPCEFAARFHLQPLR